MLGTLHDPIDLHVVGNKTPIQLLFLKYVIGGGGGGK